MVKRERQAWMIAISLFIALFFLWGGGYNTAPIFLAALLKAFGWSHGRVSWISAGLALAIGVSAPIGGWLLDRIEARIVMGAGALIAVLGMFCASCSQSFEPLLLSVILIGIGLGTSTWLPASTVIVNWFPDRRGLALGIVTAGMESGGMVMAYLVGSIIATHGWQAGYFTIAVPGLLIVLPLLLIFVRMRPAGVVQTAAERADALPGYEVREALRTRAFWMLVAVQLTYGIAVGGTYHHLVAYLEGISYSLHSATVVVSILLGMAAIGKPIMGAVGDRIGGKNALGIGLLMIAAGVFILLDAQQTAMLVLWLFVIGIAGAAPIALVPMVTAETLGLKRFGTLYGWLGSMLTLGLFIGPLTIGWLTDVTGSYTKPFELCALVAMVGSAASFLCVAPRPADIPIIGKAATSASIV
jgi:MFS family permease